MLVSLLLVHVGAGGSLCISVHAEEGSILD
jgi:hypothetical protein